jgi:hypothetical protein
VTPHNAFYVLELSPDASPGEIERKGRALLGLIELGAAKGVVYTCSLGTFPRDATAVREAMARLRDPAAREQDAFLARLAGDAADDVPAAADAPFDEAFLLAGYEGL